MKESERLEVEVEDAQKFLTDKTKEYHAALINEYPVKVGDVINCGRRGEALVTRVGVRYGTVHLYGNLKLKGGAWGKAERDIWYGFSYGVPEIIRTAAQGAPHD